MARTRGGKGKGTEFATRKKKPKQADPTRPVAERKREKVGRYADEASHTNARGNREYTEGLSQSFDRRVTRGQQSGNRVNYVEPDEQNDDQADTSNVMDDQTSAQAATPPPAQQVTTSSSALPPPSAVPGQGFGGNQPNLASAQGTTASAQGNAVLGQANLALTQGSTSATQDNIAVTQGNGLVTPGLDAFIAAGIIPSPQANAVTPTVPNLAPTSSAVTSTGGPASSAPRSGSGREKKESRKKREAKPSVGSVLKELESAFKAVESPLRFKVEGDLTAFDITGRAITFNPVHVSKTLADQVFHEVQEHPKENSTTGWKYSPCVSDPAFVATNFTTTEQAPYEPRFSFHAHGSGILLSKDGLKATNPAGYQAARTNVALREGVYYWEVKVLSNAAKDYALTPGEAGYRGGALRVGIMRPEGHLEKNIGADACSYGITDKGGRVVHAANTRYIKNSAEADFGVGDVFGLRLTLPPLEIHQKVVDGTYNPAVDGLENWLSLPAYSVTSPVNVVRDRNPFRHKGKQLFFEQQNYDRSHMEPADATFGPLAEGFRLSMDRLFGPRDTGNMNHVGGVAVPAKSDFILPNPNHPDPAFRTLPGSKFELFKNGKFVSVLVEDLLAFLVPASKLKICEGRPPGREYADDGSLGYYPAVSCYYGGAVEICLKEPFWYGLPTAADAAAQAGPSDPKASASTKKDKGKGKAKATAVPPAAETPKYEVLPVKSIEDRYNEQIAEEIVYDVVDEVEAALTDEILRGGMEAPVVAAAAPGETQE